MSSTEDKFGLVVSASSAGLLLSAQARALLACQGRGGEMDPDKLVTVLANGHLWLVFGAAFAFGVLGALIHRGSTPDVRAPAEPPKLGRDVLTGGIAALAILYVTDPATGVALVAGSLVAGYAAKTVMAGLEARITSMIAQREAIDSKRQADVAKRNLESLVDRVSSLPDLTAPAAVDMNHLASVKQLAREMKTQLFLQ